MSRMLATLALVLSTMACSFALNTGSASAGTYGYGYDQSSSYTSSSSDYGSDNCGTSYSSSYGY